MTEERPLITFMLIAYKQEQFIAEAVQGAFSQTYTPLEIILSDDCSPDRTFKIMQEMAEQYQGPHTIVLNRNECNLGMIGNINRVMEIAKGELIVAAAGDDISFPERAERLCEAYLASDRRAYSIFSNGYWMDEHGKQMNPLRKRPVLSEELTLESYVAREKPGFINGCAHAWRRETFDIFGPLPIDVSSEDTTIPFRSALLGQIIYLHDPLVSYRRDVNRLKDHKGLYSFQKYREAWVKHNTNHLAVYRCRLSDIDYFRSSLLCHDVKKIECVREVTKNKITRLENKLDRSVGHWWNYMKIILYHQYQNLWKFIIKFLPTK
ncbi:MAG: glycosyltransferase [Anaerolineales bacterium]|nr:glycosyltransferase [Anaerolineales bacterium]